MTLTFRHLPVLNEQDITANFEQLQTEFTTGTIKEIETKVLESFSNTGLADPRTAPYNAKCDGTTDDTEAFNALHAAINAETIKGYFVPSTAKISGGNLTVIKKPCEIRFFAGAELDFSENFTASRGLNIEGSLNTAQALTANAELGDYTLKCATAYNDETILFLEDPTTVWDEQNGTHPGEFLEAGRPEGMFSGINGETKTTEIKEGEKVKELTITNVNPSTPATIWPATGTVEMGPEDWKYTSREIIVNGVKFTLEKEETATEKFNEGRRVVLAQVAGTIFLRQAVSHEFGYTTANSSKVRSVNAVRDLRIMDAKIRGPLFKEGIVGINCVYCVGALLYRPRLRDCWRQGVKYESCVASHVIDPYILNSREINMGLGGGSGYGVNFTVGTQDSSVRGGRSICTRHSFTYATGGTGLPRRNIVIDHIAEGAFADAFDTHAGGVSVAFLRCAAISPNAAGFNMNCPQASIKDCTVYRCGTSGVQCSNRSIGKNDYDIDVNVIEPLSGGVAIGAASATFGTETRRIRVRGNVEKPKAYGVLVQGSGEGAAINWKYTNVDIDFSMSGGPSETPYRGVYVTASENVRIKLASSGLHKANHQVELRDVQQFLVDLGPTGWAEASTGFGVNCIVGAGGAEGGTTNGVIREGPMLNLGKESVKLDANCTKIMVVPGPNQKVALGAGAGNFSTTPNTKTVTEPAAYETGAVGFKTEVEAKAIRDKLNEVIVLLKESHISK